VVVEMNVRFTVERARERESAVPELFFRRPRQVSTREVNMERIWGYDFEPTAVPLEPDVSCLRRATGAREPRVSQRVRGVGSGLREP
jgi:DNA-binding response OmpR family regulator